MNPPDLQRLLVPRTIALIGSGAWTDAVAAGARTLGFDGEVWRVHPTRASRPGAPFFRSVAALPDAPDSAFIAAPNHEVPAIAAALASRGAGGFVCFSSGFAETATPAGLRLAQELEHGAGSLPFLGPNCYGMVNFFDRVALWPDQVVGGSPERGVALISQSGTIALTLMFADRSLPIGYLLTVGNQARLAAEDLVDVLSDDPRVTAFGLYLEGIKDTGKFARAVDKARAHGKPIAVVKSGRTEAASRTARSHTGALSGTDTVFDAYCAQAGIARCETLSTLCETLKIFHGGGPLAGRRVVVMGASGGDMAMTADVSRHLALEFPPFAPDTTARMSAIVGERVTVANPFDMHTYLWFQHATLRQLFDEVFRSDVDAVGFTLDCPPAASADDSAYTAVIEQFAAASQGATPRGVFISSLPETAGGAVRSLCFAKGLVPLQGQREALEALHLAAAVGEAWRLGTPPLLSRPAGNAGAVLTLDESTGKAALGAFGLHVPRSQVVPTTQAAAAAAAVGFPVVVKATGAALEHKTEVGGVVLGVRDASQATAAGNRLAALSGEVLVEQMIDDGVAEILVGVTVDEQFGQVLLLGSGGVQAELWQDTVTLLPPWSRETVAAALRRLKVFALLAGYRGQPAGDVEVLVDAIVAIGRYAVAHRDTLVELDVNPIIVRPRGSGAVAVDVLIRKAEES
jgi:acetate---CoA ligase (ADP-forming)